MLINDFFTIKEVIENEKGCVYRLSLNAEHPIYHAHFQGNPITPGACIIQMVKELAGDYHSTSFFIRNVKNVKFLSVINPLENNLIDIHLTFRTDEGDRVAVSAVIDRDKVVFCKLSLVLVLCHQCSNSLKSTQMTQIQQICADIKENLRESFKSASSACKKTLETPPDLQAQMDSLNLCIIIPTYNNAQTLCKVLNDVLNYTTSIIVVNDGSTDGTSEIL
jgi:3-hydroxyacyl-[acyl-carrier-protein] dehydratase